MAAMSKTTEAPVLEIPEPQVAAPVEPESTLGPAVTPEFGGLPGIQDLLAGGGGGGGGGGRGSKGAAAPHGSVASSQASTVRSAAPPPAVLGPDVLRTTLVQVDATVSTMLEVEATDPDYMGQMADGLLPLANYYASQKPSVTALWVVAAVSLLSYVAIKYQQVHLKQQKAVEHGSEAQQQGS